jgi:hypothetical protein
MLTRSVSNQIVYQGPAGNPQEDLQQTSSDSKIKRAFSSSVLGKRKPEETPLPQQDNIALGVALARQYTADVYGDAFTSITLIVRIGGMCAVSPKAQKVKIVKMQTISLEVVNGNKPPIREDLITHHFDSQTPDQISNGLKPLIDELISTIQEEH